MVYIEDNDLGSIIREARTEYNLTQEQFAEKANISSRYLQSIEKGRNLPGYKILNCLVHELNIPPKALFYSAESEHSSLIDEIVVLLEKSTESSLKVIKATAQALLETENGGPEVSVD